MTATAPAAHETGEPCEPSLSPAAASTTAAAHPSTDIGTSETAGAAGAPLASLCALTGHGDYVQALAWSPCGARIATGCDGAVVRVWDASGLMARAQVRRPLTPDP